MSTRLAGMGWPPGSVASSITKSFAKCSTRMFPNANGLCSASLCASFASQSRSGATWSAATCARMVTPSWWGMAGLLGRDLSWRARRAGHPLPRLEGVGHAAQGGAKLRVMAKHDVGHRRLLHPVHPELRVDLRREVLGEIAVAVKPARRHDDEDPEGGVAESEARRPLLGQHADDRVDRIDVAVQLAERRQLSRVVGHVLEALGGLQVQEPPELVVARHAEFTGTQDVGGRQVH